MNLNLHYLNQVVPTRFMIILLFLLQDLHDLAVCLQNFLASYVIRYLPLQLQLHQCRYYTPFGE